MKKFRIAAYNRSYGVTKVFAEIVEAPTAQEAKAKFEQAHRRSWVTHITEI